MSDLFRKEAVENYTSNREATLSVRAIPVRWVLYIIILILCVTLFCVWLFGGTVYESETVRGIAWPNKSYGDVYAEKRGIVAKTTVSVGDTVEAGDILAFMPDEDMLDVPEEEKNYEAYDRASVIRAKTNGIVTYIIDRNSYVNEGDLIAAVISYDKNGNNDIFRYCHSKMYLRYRQSMDFSFRLSLSNHHLYNALHIMSTILVYSLPYHR